MNVFIAMLLTVLTFGFIAYPLVKRRVAIPADLDEDENLQELHSRRDTVYSMLKELEFDFQSGILSEDDYHDLEKRYKRRAVSVLKAMDTVGKGTDIEDDIEKRVLALRKGQVDSAVDEPRQIRGRFCSQCGMKYQEGDRFCSQCGAKLR